MIKRRTAQLIFQTAYCTLGTDVKTIIAHCPASNMNLTSGMTPIRNYLVLGLDENNITAKFAAGNKAGI